jgi:two-component system chemotaxis response regulator CheB
MINVLIVEDSPVALALLSRILGADPTVHIMGAVHDGEEALEFLKQHKPDVITMDIQMPKLDGFETTRRIMEAQPVPIVIVSASVMPQEVSLTFRAIEAGAVAAVEKPRGPDHPDYETLARKLVQTVKAMAEVKVVRRWAKARPVGTSESKLLNESKLPIATQIAPAITANKSEIVAIGVSTGGPPVLETILSQLPANFGAPILIVQHIAAGFLPGLVEWLNRTATLPVRIATAGEPLLPGHAFLAPDSWHMGADRKQIILSRDAPEGNLRPAASFLFRSVATSFGANAIGVLLTGMGRDGAAELKLMRDKGAVTIAQDRESSVVHGMPGEAIRLKAATYVLPPAKIATALSSLVNKTSQG